MNTWILLFLVAIVLVIILFVMCRPQKITPPRLPGLVIEKMFEFAGEKRNYTCYSPKDLPDGPPIVIAMHQSGSNGKKFRELLKYRLDELAEANRFVVVYPDALNGKWNDCRNTKKKTKAGNTTDDAGFICKIIDHLTAEYQTDVSKMYLFGMSNGGHMCLRMAIEHPDRIAAIAPLLAQLPEVGKSLCSGLESPMPIMLLHGTKDPISPYGGGQVAALGVIKFGSVESVDTTLEAILALNRIEGKPELTKIAGSGKLWAEKRAWRGESQDTMLPQVQQYIIYGGGHTLPGTCHLPRLVFGKTFDGLVIADEVVDFFMGCK